MLYLKILVCSSLTTGFGIFNIVMMLLTAFIVLTWFSRGAFKIRGASNAIFSLEDNEVQKGVLTHSRFSCFNPKF